MRSPFASVVDTSALLKVVWVSLAGGIGVAAAFSLVVFGLARGREAQREHRSGASAAFFIVCALGLAACAWALYRGYEFVVTKA